MEELKFGKGQKQRQNKTTACTFARVCVFEKRIEGIRPKD